MSGFVVAGLIGAALVFVGVSGIMNAVFLAGLGRTHSETMLLAAVSVAADMAKLVLPVVLVQSWRLVQWLRFGMAAMMLVVVVGLSVTSGVGFASNVRDGASAAQDARRGQKSRLQRDLQDTDERLSAVAKVRDAAVIRQEISAAERHTLFAASTTCTAPKSPAMRRHCAEWDQSRVLLAQAESRDALLKTRTKLRQELDAVDAGVGGRDGEAQLSALGDMLGWSRRTIKVGLGLWIALTLELGGFVLVGLAAALAGEPRSAQTPLDVVSVRPDPMMDDQEVPPRVTPSVQSQLPVMADRLYWQKQRRAGAVGCASAQGGTS